MVKVFVRKNNVEQSLLEFLEKRYKKEGILKRVRQTRYFESPSEKRIRKEKEGRKNFLKKKETGEIRSFINSFESLKRGHCDLSFLGLGLYYNFITITI